MEVTTGVVGLVSVVTSCIELTKTIQLGRNFANDLDTYELRLDLMKCRFSVCCESIVQYCNTNGESTIIESATCVFDKVQSLFKQAQEKSDAFRKGAQSKDSLKLATSSDEISLSQKARHCWNTIQNKNQEETKKIQKMLKTKDKIRWAVYEKETFNKLVEDITILVDGMERMFPTAVDIFHRQIMQRAIDDVLDQEYVKEITEAARKDDRVLHDIGKKKLRACNNKYIGNRQTGASKVVNGNITVAGWAGGRQESSNYYEGNVAEGHGRTVNGNQYGGKGIFDD
ncbi:hypothetical protein EYC84_000481 [Monilinia fructicola]|uniref:Prion-inhibition and propagation HeLo domain-containing protein n=1 Tax=Monilinia fructicola TaxID=38448 RepID=A0A5M9JTF8_MONFR|nr:hypothetical protein EYC84_000481 [Monilinia fructicola]